MNTDILNSTQASSGLRLPPISVTKMVRVSNAVSTSVTGYHGNSEESRKG